MAGTVDYNEYSSEINDMNNTLQTDNSDYKVRLIVQGDQEQLLYLNAGDFIEEENDDDVNSWNQSFGVGL